MNVVKTATGYDIYFGGTQVMQIVGATTNFILQTDMLKLEPVTAPPETCASAFEGAIYSDSDLSLPCFCTGTGWVQMDDFSTACSQNLYKTT